MTPKISSEKIVYEIHSQPIITNGLGFSDVDLNVALGQRLPQISDDLSGKQQILELLGGLAQTAFDVEQINHALQVPCTLRDWQVGVAMLSSVLRSERAVQVKEPCVPYGVKRRRP